MFYGGFGNAYHWYCILEISLEEYIQQCLQVSTPSLSGLCPGPSLFQDTSVSSSKKWASEYLQKHCPLCFGCHNWQSNNSSNIDAIVCIDACFTQKRRSGLQDDPVNPTATGGLLMHSSTLLMGVQANTGVMALLCHHDHVIHLANMTSAGAKPHYALALIKSLFSHQPDNFHIGLLYDIGCQLE
ncbi:hypothetical protein BKA83DRAFT_108908 [Pisolithus microcarpus]|nr:hypothetical protein BKA83DRAFT_108908 [Pisolithus microcarpus]